MTFIDKVRLRNQRLGITRIMFTSLAFEKHLKDKDIKHTPFKRVHGACSTAYTVCDLINPKQLMFLQIEMPGQFRVLMPNEPQYQAYDDKSLWEKLQYNYDEEEYAVSDDEDEE